MLITDEELKARQIHEAHGSNSIKFVDEKLDYLEKAAHKGWMDHERLKNIQGNYRFYVDIKSILIKMVNGN